MRYKIIDVPPGELIQPGLYTAEVLEGIEHDDQGAFVRLRLLKPEAEHTYPEVGDDL